MLGPTEVNPARPRALLTHFTRPHEHRHAGSPASCSLPPPPQACAEVAKAQARRLKQEAMGRLLQAWQRAQQLSMVSRRWSSSLPRLPGKYTEPLRAIQACPGLPARALPALPCLPWQTQSVCMQCKPFMSRGNQCDAHGPAQAEAPHPTPTCTRLSHFHPMHVGRHPAPTTPPAPPDTHPMMCVSQATPVMAASLAPTKQSNATHGMSPWQVQAGALMPTHHNMISVTNTLHNYMVHPTNAGAGHAGAPPKHYYLTQVC